MRVFILLLMLCACQGWAQKKGDVASIATQPGFQALDQRDLFVITEYKKIEYQVFLDRDSLNLPANLSSVNYYVDINGQADSSNLVDINYLYLQGYHERTKVSGELVYLLSSKHIPMGDRNRTIPSPKLTDHYSDLSSIIAMSFGYWQLDTVTHRVFIVFRDRTNIWNMNNFRVFAGLVLNKNIYLTKAMNPKDEYLFDYNFKKNKEVFVKLPLNLDRVFYSEPIKTSDTMGIRRATLSTVEAEKEMRLSGDTSPKTEMINWLQKKNTFNESEEPNAPTTKITALVADQKLSDKTFNATIKYSYYPVNKKLFFDNKIEHLSLDSLSFEFQKSKNGKRASEAVVLKASKNGVQLYSKIEMKQYKGYYSSINQKEIVLIHVIDPYDENSTHTFKIPYSGDSFSSHIVYFLRKKVLNL